MEFLSGESVELMTRLSVALFAGVLIGLQRSRIGKHAGMRTFGLVSLGAALFVVMSIYVAVQAAPLEGFVFDPLRVASQVVVGIGFLGAGVIFFNKHDHIAGLTTAAGLWVSAGIGAAAGFGMYAITLFATLAVLFVFEVLWHVENKFVKDDNNESV